MKFNDFPEAYNPVAVTPASICRCWAARLPFRLPWGPYPGCNHPGAVTPGAQSFSAESEDCIHLETDLVSSSRTMFANRGRGSLALRASMVVAGCANAPRGGPMCPVARARKLQLKTLPL